MIFGKNLYTQWFLFLDDLTVATGRPESVPPGPSGAKDVVDTCSSISASAVADLRPGAAVRHANRCQRTEFYYMTGRFCYSPAEEGSAFGFLCAGPPSGNGT